MKDAYEVLYKKEADLIRVRREVDSLTIAAKLLIDDELGISDNLAPVGKPKKSVQSVTSRKSAALPEAQPFVWPRSSFWGTLRLRR